LITKLKVYKKEFDGHSEITSERDQEIKFLREGNTTIARDSIEDISLNEGPGQFLGGVFLDCRVQGREGRETFIEADVGPCRATLW